MDTMHDGRTRWPHDWHPAPATRAPVDPWTHWAGHTAAAWLMLAEQAVQATIAAWDIHGVKFV